MLVRYCHSSVQLIQLVEGPPPPPRRTTDPSVPSSSSGSSSDAEGSSYCSSIVTPDDVSPDRTIPWTDETYAIRMKRVQSWRDGFVKATCDPSETRTHSLKRKTVQTDDDSVSHTSKRSRDGHSMARLSSHPCPACDALFPTLASLRTHGRDPDAPEACRVAVAYNFE